MQGKGIVAQLASIVDRDQAESLIGSKILVPSDALPKLPEGEYYWHQLLGLAVSNQDQELGVIASLMETGANDVLVV